MHLHPILAHVHVMPSCDQCHQSPTWRDVCQCAFTVADSGKKKVEAIMAIELIQREMVQQSCGSKKASLGSETGFVADMVAPIDPDKAKPPRRLCGSSSSSRWQHANTLRGALIHVRAIFVVSAICTLMHRLKASATHMHVHCLCAGATFVL